MRRCHDEHDQAYKSYGELGISVCPEWFDFKVFLIDMGNRPDGTSLDRIDGAKGYSRDNCRWATRTQQNRNRSNSRHVTLDGQTKTLSEWAEDLGVNRRLIQSRLAGGANSVSDMKPKTTQSRGSFKSKKGNYVTVNGITLKITEWAKRSGIAHSTISQRVKYGWSIEDAVSTPKTSKKS